MPSDAVTIHTTRRSTNGIGQFDLFPIKVHSPRVGNPSRNHSTTKQTKTKTLDIHFFSCVSWLLLSVSNRFARDDDAAPNFEGQQHPESQAITTVSCFQVIGQEVLDNRWIKNGRATNGPRAENGPGVAPQFALKPKMPEHHRDVLRSAETGITSFAIEHPAVILRHVPGQFHIRHGYRITDGIVQMLNHAAQSWQELARTNFHPPQNSR